MQRTFQLICTHYAFSFFKMPNIFWKSQTYTTQILYFLEIFSGFTIVCTSEILENFQLYSISYCKCFMYSLSYCSIFYKTSKFCLAVLWYISCVWLSFLVRLYYKLQNTYKASPRTTAFFQNFQKSCRCTAFCTPHLKLGHSFSTLY